MREKYRIPLMKPYFDEAEIAEIQKALHSGWVSQGPKSEEFERTVAHYLQVPEVIGVANCTSALHLALLSSGIRKGDEVLVADYTFPATGHAVVYCGATPRFVDIDEKTYNIDPLLIEDKITEHTKALIPVHTFGQPAPMDEIMAISREHDLTVIEDAACAFGATYKGMYAGLIGDIGCYSFHARKGITTGEGGMVVAKNREIMKKIRMLSTFGMTAAWEREKTNGFSPCTFTELGYNYKLSDINAAIGIAQLKKLDAIITRKKMLAAHWNDVLTDMKGIHPPFVDENVTHIYQSYVALVDRGIKRDEVIRKLMKKHIQTTIGTYACHIQPVYQSEDECPHSLDIYERALALPMFYTLKEEDIDYTASALKKTLRDVR
ncbi:MAG: DegT/DnrJ/EryC1/StrS family aminotransferase [Theionarchaea archaeon]|nr:DegT/DnrJ/EryC1/StrS family aminotransferase [Theionarchaea archaeon]